MSWSTTVRLWAVVPSFMTCSAPPSATVMASGVDGELAQGRRASGPLVDTDPAPLSSPAAITTAVNANTRASTAATPKIASTALWSVVVLVSGTVPPGGQGSASTILPERRWRAGPSVAPRRDLGPLLTVVVARSEDDDRPLTPEDGLGESQSVLASAQEGRARWETQAVARSAPHWRARAFSPSCSGPVMPWTQNVVGGPTALKPRDRRCLRAARAAEPGTRAAGRGCRRRRPPCSASARAPRSTPGCPDPTPRLHRRPS